MTTTSILILITTLFFISSIILLLLKRSAKKNSSSSSSKQIPGPWKLPIIGNLHQMVGPSLPHRRLADLAQEYGPLMQLQMGEVPCVVVSSPEWAKQFLQTHDATFASRSPLPAADVMFYGARDLLFAPYGDYSREMRKIFTTELLSNTRVKSLRPIREQEIGKLMDSIRRHVINTGTPAQAVNVSRMLMSLGNSITSRAAFGKSSDQKQVEAFLPHTQDIIEKLGVMSPVEVFPSSKFLRFVTGFDAKMNKIHMAADAIMETIISDHMARRSSAKHDISNDDDGGGGEEEEEEEEDLVDALLNLKQKNGDHGFHFTNVEIKAAILDVFLAGIGTWTVLTEWAMSELMKNPKVMEKAQKEVRQVFDGKGKAVNEAWLDELQYLQLVTKETLRLHPPAPLTIPRESQKTTMIDGYEIPANTRVIVNISALGRDPNRWIEPDTFDPERYLKISTDYKGLDFSFLPFGSGRRLCPAIQYAVTIVNLVLANFLYHFDWKLPNETNPEDLDMSEKFGLEVTRKNNLFLVPALYHPK